MRPLRTLHVMPLVIALAAAPVLVSCADDDRDGPDGRPTDGSSSAQPAGEIAAAAELCTSIVNERDAAVFDAGKDAAFEVVAAAIAKGAGPSAQDLSGWGSAMAAMKDALALDRARVADATDLPAQDAVLAPMDAWLALLEKRIAVTEDDAWPPAEDDLGIGGPDGPAEVDVDALAAAGLAGRDCEVLGSYSGPSVAAPTFSAEAADTCRTIVDRRRLDDFDTAADTALDIVVAVKEGRTVEVTDAEIEAVTALGEEWQRTHDDLAAVPTEDLGDPALWQTNVDLAADRVKVYGDRLSALESKDVSRIETAFDPGVLGVPGWDWASVGLDRRDCRSIRA